MSFEDLGPISYYFKSRFSGLKGMDLRFSSKERGMAGMGWLLFYVALVFFAVIAKGFLIANFCHFVMYIAANNELCSWLRTH